MRSHLLAAFHDVSLLSQLIADDTHQPRLPHKCVSLRVGTHLRARLACLGKLFTWAATAATATQLGTWGAMPCLADERKGGSTRGFAASRAFPAFRTARSGTLASFNSVAPEDSFYFRVQGLNLEISFPNPFLDYTMATWFFLIL